MNWTKSKLSTTPIDLSKIDPANADKEMLRVSIISELDAINLYEQFADMTDDPEIKKVMLSVAKEEKVHVIEFETLLKGVDKESEDVISEGEKEVSDLVGGI
jgi:rubrerythrin